MYFSHNAVNIIHWQITLTAHLRCYAIFIVVFLRGEITKLKKEVKYALIVQPGYPENV